MNFIWTGCPASGLYFRKKPKCKPDGVPSGSHFHLKNVNRIAFYSVYNFFQNVNRMEGIRFSNFKKKKQKVILVIFTGTILTFSKLMEVQDEGIGVQKESVFTEMWKIQVVWLEFVHSQSKHQDWFFLHLHIDFLYLHNFAYFHFSPEEKDEIPFDRFNFFFLFTDCRNRNAIKKYFFFLFTDCTNGLYNSQLFFLHLLHCGLYKPQV